MKNPIRILTISIALKPDVLPDTVFDMLSDERDRGAFVEWAVTPNADGERRSQLVEAEDAADLFQSDRVWPEEEVKP